MGVRARGERGVEDGVRVTRGSWSVREVRALARESESSSESSERVIVSIRGQKSRGRAGEVCGQADSRACLCCRCVGRYTGGVKARRAGGVVARKPFALRGRDDSHELLIIL